MKIFTLAFATLFLTAVACRAENGSNEGGSSEADAQATGSTTSELKGLTQPCTDIENDVQGFLHNCTISADAFAFKRIEDFKSSKNGVKVRKGSMFCPGTKVDGPLGGLLPSGVSTFVTAKTLVNGKPRYGYESTTYYIHSDKIKCN